MCYDMTVDYLRQRKQFGRPIGSFQALQHRAVDMLTEIEQARSITIKAAAELDGAQASRYASMAKNLIGRASRLVAEEAIQLHGGIAMTWEYPVSHFAKRLVMLDHQLGDTDYHLSKIIDDLASDLSNHNAAWILEHFLDFLTRKLIKYCADLIKFFIYQMRVVTAFYV